MTTLIRQPAGGFTLPESLTATQAANSWSAPAKNVATNFGKPSYSNLTSAPVNNPMTVQNPTSQNVPQVSPSSVNFTTALIQILKEAQGRNATGQGKLMKQSQDITGQGINDANRNFKNPLLSPDSGTSLGRSATNEFDPSLLSIENQQKLGTQNLNNITDLVKQTSSDYKDEQDRIAKAKEKASNVKFDTEGNIAEVSKRMASLTGKAKGEPNGDNYIDPNAWIAMRNLWQSHGGSDASFVSNFKRYLNPESYKLAGIKEQTGDVSPEMQALLDSLGG